MRAFKFSPRQSKAASASASSHEPGVGEAADDEVLDAVMRTIDERDDAAPIGAQDVDFVEASPEPAVVASSKRGIFKHGPQLADAEDSPRHASAAAAQPPRRRIRLNWLAAKTAPADNPTSEPPEPPEPQTSAAFTSSLASPVATETPNLLSRVKAKLARKDQNAPLEVPVRVLLGFLPEVSERDALDFATGVASKHFDNLGMAFYGAFKFDNGFVYEAHEGGLGRAFVPGLIKHFQGLGAFSTDDDNKVVIRTATRAVEVSRLRNGLGAVLLPEEHKPAQPSWLRPSSALLPAVNKRTGFLVSGAVLFVSGFLAMLSASMITRLQPYAPPPVEKSDVIRYEKLPLAQWELLKAVSTDRYVKALRYEKGSWRTDTELIESSPDAATPAAMPASSSAAN